MEKRRAYGLTTAISMVVGIVIGSGIFFKADDILKSTSGNVGLGMLALTLGAMAIIFGSLTISEFATRSDRNGGLVDYFENFVSNKAAGGFGTFQTLIYYPTVNVIVSYASSIYLTIILGIKVSFEMQILIAYLIFVFILIMNVLSRRVGGYFQNITAIIKLIPLILVAILGLSSKSVSYEVTNNISFNSNISWIAALAPITFSYDGWPISTTIAGEVKDPKKNMPIALTIAPIIILISYLLFFYGVTNILEPKAIMELSDGYLNYIFVNIFGNSAGKILTILVFIAILGVVNGLSLGGIRMPQALSERNILFSKSVQKINPKYQISIKSSIIYFIICNIWMLLHYIITKYGLLNNSDISEIAVAFSYITYIILYVKAISMHKKGEIKGIFRGIISPLLAIATALFVTFGALSINFVNVIIYIVFCAIVFIIGYAVTGRK